MERHRKPEVALPNLGGHQNRPCSRCEARGFARDLGRNTTGRVRGQVVASEPGRSPVWNRARASSTPCTAISEAASERSALGWAVFFGLPQRRMVMVCYQKRNKKPADRRAFLWETALSPSWPPASGCRSWRPVRRAGSSLPRPRPPRPGPCRWRLSCCGRSCVCRSGAPGCCHRWPPA